MAASAAPGRTDEELRLVVGQRTGWAGEHALHGVAGEIAGLLPGIDVRYTDPHAVDQVGQLDGGNRADLDALAALDATGKEVTLVQRTGRTQALFLRIDQRQEAGQRGPQHAAGKQGGAQEAAAVALPLGLGQRGRRGYRRLAGVLAAVVVLVIAHDCARRSGLMKRGFLSRRIRSGFEKGARRSRKSRSSITGELRKKRAMGCSIQIWSA